MFERCIIVLRRKDMILEIMYSHVLVGQVLNTRALLAVS